MPQLIVGDKTLDLSDDVHAVVAPLIAEREALARDLKTQAEERGRLQAEAAAAAAAKADAERKAEQDALVKKGEFAAALELERKATAKIAAGYVDAQASALVAPLLRQDLTAAERADAIASVRAGLEFDLATGTLRAKDGTDPATFAGKWIADRPSLRAAKPAAGSGADDRRVDAPGLTRESLSRDRAIRNAWIEKHGAEAYAKLPAK